MQVLEPDTPLGLTQKQATEIIFEAKAFSLLNF